ncbi:MAG TPA: hypothetical protein VKX16_01260 [Chloroflexota bacterium]|nr:hypothetical protein [Chloroflexota bacterium]
MSWDIKVWHEEVAQRIKLCIESGSDVPSEVVATLAGSYWLEEVQYLEEQWEESGEPGSSLGPGDRLHG